MKINIVIFLVIINQLSVQTCFAQSDNKRISTINRTIDSLEEEISIAQSVISTLKDSITNILIEEQIQISKHINEGKGIEVLARVVNDYGDFKFYKELGKNEQGVIPVNSKIILYSKVDKYYKVGYKNKIGFIPAYYLKLDPEIFILFETNEEIPSGEQNINSLNTQKNYTPSTYKSNDIHVDGHYRTTKSGKTIYVKPYTRSKSKN
jgi:hypothetical protein